MWSVCVEGGRGVHCSLRGVECVWEGEEGWSVCVGRRGGCKDEDEDYATNENQKTKQKKMNMMNIKNIMTMTKMTKMTKITKITNMTNTTTITNISSRHPATVGGDA